MPRRAHPNRGGPGLAAAAMARRKAAPNLQSNRRRYCPDAAVQRPARSLSSDLSNYLACPHLTTLELETAHGTRAKPHIREALAQLAWSPGRSLTSRVVCPSGSSLARQTSRPTARRIPRLLARRATPPPRPCRGRRIRGQRTRSGEALAAFTSDGVYRTVAIGLCGVNLTQLLTRCMPGVLLKRPGM